MTLGFLSLCSGVAFIAGEEESPWRLSSQLPDINDYEDEGEWGATPLNAAGTHLLLVYVSMEYHLL